MRYRVYAVDPAPGSTAWRVDRVHDHAAPLHLATTAEWSVAIALVAALATRRILASDVHRTVPADWAYRRLLEQGG